MRTQDKGKPVPRSRTMNNDEFKMLAQFRAYLRQFDYFSEQQCAALGLTSQQYRALLTIKGHPGPDLIVITELAQRMMIKHNSAVGMVDRLVKEGLVRRRPSKEDRRCVGIELAPRGEQAFGRLVQVHRDELCRLSPGLRRCINHFAKSVASA